MQERMWVFGYGSLIWNPGFAVDKVVVARLHGWHRSFCMRSIHHRGTVANPGLVLALDRSTGAHCDGVAFLVSAGAEAETLSGLRERELISSAYIETHLTVELLTGGGAKTLAYVIDPDHDQYCGGLPLEEQARIIARSAGGRGPNAEYLFNTADHLETLAIADADLRWLATRVRQLGH
jgi:cation transport protein ChaC